MEPGYCPACATPANMQRDAQRDVNHIACPSCGPYYIDGVFYRQIIAGQLSQREHEFVTHDMAAFIAEEQPMIVSSPTTDSAAYTYYAKRRSHRQTP